MTDLPPPVWIDDERELRARVAEWRRSERIAVDTESNPMHSYEERLCLVQVTAGGTDFIVDPLAGIDLSPLFELLEDRNVEKIFHDGEFDVFLLRRTHGVRVRGLYDTKVVAVALGETAVGLSSLLAKHLGVQLDKKQQLSDWGRRPLSAAQVSYARLDTHYLLDLRALLEELRAGGPPILEHEIPAEFRRIEEQEPPDLEERRRTAWRRIRGASRLRPKARVALRELHAWRDAEARRRDVPPFKVLGDAQLLALAKAMPRSREALVSAAGLPAALARRYGRALLRVLQQSARLPASGEDETRKPALDREDEQVLERLRRWRKARAEARPTDPSHILHRETMLALAGFKPRPRSLVELAGTGLLEDWRLEAYGAEILLAITGRGKP